jgi:ribonuclease BN (tRNA processing enzyme)
MTFELTVLGSSGTYPTPERACTGFLITSGETNIWIDCGVGTFANLQRHMDFFDVDAVFLSHLHVDHILDLYSFYYAIRYSTNNKGPTGVPVYGPAEAEEFLTHMLSTGGAGHQHFAGFLDFRTASPDEKVEVGPFTFTFATTVHPIDVLAMRIEAEGRTLCYTSDTGWTDSLVDFAKGADVLIVEATLHQPKEELKEIHLTAQEAGRLGAEANAGKLLLTHIQPGLDPSKSVEMAGERFDGPILVAEEHLKIEV